MKTNKSKLTAILIIIVCALIAVNALTYITGKKNNITDLDSLNVPENLVITNLSVGKADCAVLKYNGYVGMIDCGTYDAFETIDSFLQSEGISKIDFLILTHYDQDHIGSAVNILNSYEVSNIYLADYVSQKEYYSSLMDAVNNRKNVFFLNENTSFNYDDLYIDIYPASAPDSLLEDNKNMDNNMSLVSMITFGTKKFLFTGDIEKDRIDQILDDNINLNADYIKMPHHGGYEKNIEDLLNIVNPSIAVISTSDERPADEKLTLLLSAMGIETYDTTYGSIVTICDKNTIKTAQKSD